MIIMNYIEYNDGVEIQNENDSCCRFLINGEFDYGGSELKTLDTIGNCQRPVFSLSDLNICIK